MTAGSAAPANGATYPVNSDLARALASTARTIRADIGAEVITVDHGSWDHHTWIGQPDNGNLRRMADEFALSLAAFLTDLGPLADRVTVVTLSEFGRRVKENANQGLDHGYGNVMFLVGAGVKGGSYYGSWPGLTNTTDADLLVTTDYRSVLSEVVTAPARRLDGTGVPGLHPRARRGHAGRLTARPAGQAKQALAWPCLQDRPGQRLVAGAVGVHAVLHRGGPRSAGRSCRRR